MKRRNTIDSLHGDWPIVQYYYTHNNGSCDDVLLLSHKSLEPTSEQTSKHQSVYKNRRKTYPLEKTAIECQQYQQDNRRDSHKVEVSSSPILQRSFPTTKRQQQQQHQQKTKRKRETLANIISNLSRSNSSTTTGGNISSSMNDDTIKVESDLDAKWETIRQYNPQLDNEKILEQDSDEEGFLPEPIPREQRSEAAVVNMDQSNNSSSSGSNDSNELFLPAGQGNTTNTTSNDIESVAIATTDDEITPTARPGPIALEANVIPMTFNPNHTDMALFLFGFVFFPLWWVGTWRYFMQTDKGYLHKQQRGFQIVNCCMTLASLLLTGLIIGLVTVWA